MDASEARARYWAPIANRTYLLTVIDDWVKECRLLGASWDQVADALEVPKTSIYRRYEPLCRDLGPVLLRVEVVAGRRRASFFSPLLGHALAEDLQAVLERAPRALEARP